MGTKLILEDLLIAGLRIVFCGMAAGKTSASKGEYYAGMGNKFWSTLYETGLTPRKLEPKEYQELLTYGIGLTDLAKFSAGNDREIKPEDLDRQSFIQKIIVCKPRALCFNGKKAAQVFYGVKKIEYGQQVGGLGDTVAFVLPSTSGSGSGFWNIVYWQEVAEYIS